MKRIIFAIALCIVSVNVNAQKLRVNTVDKFTKAVKQETSLETLYSVNFMASGFIDRFEFAIRKTDNSWTMPANILLQHIEKYDENSGVSLLLDNGNTVSLRTMYTGIGAKKLGNGYQFETCFELSDDDVAQLKSHKVTDVRVRYMGGHYDRTLKDKKQVLIQKMLSLFK